MSLVGLCSAHGSPGVTTAALALAAAWPAGREPVVVEADPFGGVVAARFGLGDTPGLASLAAAARAGLTTEVLLRHTQQLPGGLPVIVGAASPEQAAGVVRDVSAPLADLAAGEAVDVVVDCGRVAPGAATVELLRRADLVMMVVRPSTDQLRPAVHRLHTLAATGATVSLLLVGDTPYRREEITSTLSVDVAGVLAFDPDAAAAINGTAPIAGLARGRLRRSTLARSAATLTEHLVARLGITTPEAAPVSGGGVR